MVTEQRQWGLELLLIISSFVLCPRWLIVSICSSECCLVHCWRWDETWLRKKSQTKWGTVTDEKPLISKSDAPTCFCFPNSLTLTFNYSKLLYSVHFHSHCLYVWIVSICDPGLYLQMKTWCSFTDLCWWKSELHDTGTFSFAGVLSRNESLFSLSYLKCDTLLVVELIAVSVSRGRSGDRASPPLQLSSRSFQRASAKC